MENLELESIETLRQRWENAWGFVPHIRIGRKMLVQSLLHKESKDRLEGAQRKKFEQMLSRFERGPENVARETALKAGTHLVRVWNQKEHRVEIRADGFLYEGTRYKSLSQVARQITGSQWNGWLFFGLKGKAK